MKLQIAIITGLIVAAMACQDALDADIYEPFNDGEFMGGIGDTLISENQDNSKLPFVFRIVDIQESRCPTTVTCIRLGEVVVFTQMRFPDQDQFTDHDFCQGDCPLQGTGTIDTLDVFYRNDGYRIVLKEVVPFPEEPEAELSQKAIFTIMKL